MIPIHAGIILAAGVGNRFQSDKPKQYFTIDDKPILFYTIQSMLKASILDRIIIVFSKPYLEYGDNMIKETFSLQEQTRIHVCAGGETRQESLYNGVLYAQQTFDAPQLKIVSHDAARPLLPEEVIDENIALIQPGKSVDTVRRVYDTMLYKDESGKIDFIDRDRLFSGLTPQSFYAHDYLNAYEQLGDTHSTYTCACSLMAAAGYEILLYITNHPIHKVTVPEDATIIKQHLKEWAL
ncbi:IspD/TarI family cytidylyltransferase [Mechercharimyces sp. CAU 1602]|uniref:IspD/TarI family cytidylyltransferase n=1 Tax=Mechercharimyces sp. CAU 1602 TaxID=2973933 RepID=UPI002163F791|nr:IspD/TarI family cytidylyltransferase [Mechercharimyces sp. CAU 1602]MCS1351825.1 2-C-methyl-D-erythritol 4-phosphate cytidylyltransferase [Mechercharimyces sp. CAU 1602]